MNDTSLSIWDAEQWDADCEQMLAAEQLYYNGYDLEAQLDALPEDALERYAYGYR